MMNRLCDDRSYICGEYGEMTQEDLYFGLVSGALEDDALEKLFYRLRGLIYRMSKGYMRFLSMDFNDISQETMLLLWGYLSRKIDSPRKELSFPATMRVAGIIG